MLLIYGLDSNQDTIKNPSVLLVIYLISGLSTFSSLKCSLLGDLILQNTVQHEFHSLDEILAKHQASSYQLPPLRPTVSSLQEKLTSWVNWLGGLLQDLLAQQNNPIKKPLLFYVSTFLFTVLLLFLLFFLLKLASTFFKNRRHPTTLASTQRQEPNRPEDIEALIRQAKDRGDFALAARWRWRLFLIQSKWSPSQTFFESFPGEIKQSSFYGLMFRPGSHDPIVFDEFDHWLAQKRDRSLS